MGVSEILYLVDAPEERLTLTIDSASPENAISEYLAPQYPHEAISGEPEQGMRHRGHWYYHAKSGDKLITSRTPEGHHLILMKEVADVHTPLISVSRIWDCAQRGAHTDLLSKYEVGVDGRTSYNRSKGKPFSHEVAELGEKIHFKYPKHDHEGMHNLEGHWWEGSFLETCWRTADDCRET